MHSYTRYKSALPEKWLPQFSSPLETAKTRVLRVATEVRDETSRLYFFSLDCRTTRHEYLRNPRTLWIINVHSVHNRTRRRYVGQNKAFFISRKLRVATRRILRTEYVNNDVCNYRAVRSKNTRGKLKREFGPLFHSRANWIISILGCSVEIIQTVFLLLRKILARDWKYLYPYLQILYEETQALLFVHILCNFARS